MLVVRRRRQDGGPDAGTPLPPLQPMERPAEDAVAGKSVSHHHRHSAWQRTERRRVYGDTRMTEMDWAPGAYGDTGVTQMD